MIAGPDYSRFLSPGAQAFGAAIGDAPRPQGILGDIGDFLHGIGFSGPNDDIGGSGNGGSPDWNRQRRQSGFPDPRAGLTPPRGRIAKALQNFGGLGGKAANRAARAVRRGRFVDFAKGERTVTETGVIPATGAPVPVQVLRGNNTLTYTRPGGKAKSVALTAGSGQLEGALRQAAALATAVRTAKGPARRAARTAQRQYTRAAFPAR
jgi:hypothetical protein